MGIKGGYFPLTCRVCLNSFGNKITKPMEIANLLNYRFSILGEFIGLQETNNIVPKTAPRNFLKFRYITNKEIYVIIDLLHASKPLGSSKIPAWAIKDSKAALAEPLCFLINQFITEGKFPEDLKKAQKTHSIIDLFLSFLLGQKFLKMRSVHKSQFS